MTIPRQETGHARTEHSPLERPRPGHPGQQAPTGLAAAEVAVQRATRILIARQDTAGWWSGGGAADITLDAEALLLREYLGLRTPELTSAVAQHIRSAQQADGSWAGGDVSASVLAYLSLRLAGDSADAYHLAVAAGWIRDAGGLLATSAATRTWLAVFGLTGWADVPVSGPEGLFLPARYTVPRSERAGWSRLALVTLTVLRTLRPARQVPFEVPELRAGGQDRGDRTPRTRTPAPMRAATSAARSAALRRCGQWIVDWQLRAGQPAWPRTWACALVALSALGYPLSHPAIAGGLAWLDSVAAPPRPAAAATRPAGMHKPPVRDTTAVIGALADAGLAPGDPALTTAGGWLLEQRIEGPVEEPGRTSRAPCGWSFGTEGYPAVADTAEVLTALSLAGLHGRAGGYGMAGGYGTASQPAISAATRWLASVQGKDGNWAGSAAVTAQVVRALAAHGRAGSRAVRRGVVWLLLAQRPDGSWPGRRGDGDLAVTAQVLTALLAAGVRPAKPVIRTAVGWLLDRQSPDGGWGCSGPGPAPAISLPHQQASRSDPARTGQVLAALLAAGGSEVDGAADLAVGLLVRAQQADGGWGTRPAGRSGPRRDALVPGLLFPLSALGRYLAARHRRPGCDAAGAIGGQPGPTTGSDGLLAASGPEPAPGGEISVTRDR